jgi:hypothetical protein
MPHVIIISAVTALVYILGKELNWDQYNYHLYLPHAFLNDRLGVDWLAASTNTYLNPLPYLPFYWMTMADWDSFAVAGSLGAFHALNISAIWVLAHRFLLADHPNRLRFSVVATILAGITPVYIALVGGSFLEASLSVFTLAGLLAACAALGANTLQPSLWFVASGIIFGASMGFKLTGIVFATAMVLALLYAAPGGRKIRATVIFVSGLVVGYLITNGWLAWHLLSEFRNPVFPFFNGVFQSADFLPVNLSHDRFRWNSVSELAQLPFSMAIPLSWVYVEPKVPDIRPAALVVTGLMLVVLLFITRIRGGPTSTQSPASRLTVAFVVAAIPFWLATSANARYGLPIMLLLGPLLVMVVTNLVKHAEAATYVLITVIAWQLVQQSFAGSPRWDSADWTSTWYVADVPKELKTEPYAYVSLGETHSNSFIAPFLHPESVYTSLAGNTFTVSPELPSSQRHHRFLRDNANRLRTSFAIRNTSDHITNLDKRHIDDHLAAWNLKADYDDCIFFRINVERADANSDLYDGPGPIDLRDRLNNKYDTRIASCRIVSGPGESDAIRLERARIERVFDRIEASCPLLFSPRGWHLSRTVSGWKRHYLRSDILLGETRGQLSLRRDLFGPFDVPVGSVDAWERGEVPFKCERLKKHWQRSLDE